MENVKETKKAAVKKSNGLKTETNITRTKMDRAKEIMQKHWKELQSGKMKRKDIIEMFVDEVGFTKLGASTYFTTIKKKLIDSN